MNDDQGKAKTIFQQAAEIASVDQRQAYVAAACGGDEALRGEVESLLRHHDQLGPFLEPAAEGLVATIEQPRPSEGPATVIGPYKLLQQIGEGGMGAVFMAEQMQPVRRKVALKLIKPGMDSRQVIARFEAERQALALMDHPNIAKVFDAGATEAGRPYFVMELVKGAPLTKYCDEYKLTPKQRLELFMPVCQAVQHAHQKGIIHRDLKPSNVLVALYDGKPVPKVIDFGIAKATGQKLTERTLFTEFGAVVGTLEYMSPEQAELNQLDIDTRSDIYSLGVMLYELLTGTTPLERRRLKATGLVELLRIIREEEPPRPSVRLSTTEELPAIAASRGLEPKKLSGVVRGELDWIVMKALEKDRNRRYETVSAFAADVERYLHDEPVLAWPPSVSYRLRKFVRRNKGPVLGASVIVLLLLAGIVGTTTGLVRALAAERQAVTERDEKEGARRQTRQALNTMTDEVVEELLGRQVQLTDQHREFLKKVLAYHEAFAAAKADDPEGRQSRADGNFRVGRIRFSLGEFKEAESAYRDALALRKQLGADFPTKPEFRENLADSHNYLGHLLSATGRPKEAESAYRDALALREQLAADFPTKPEFRQELATSHHNLGIVLRNAGRPKEAETAYRDALTITKQLAADFPSRPEFREDLATGHYTLAELLSAGGRLKEAETAYRDSLTITKRLAAEFPNRPEVRKDLAMNQITLGVMLRGAGQPKEAEAAYREALTTAKQLAVEFPARPDFRQELGMAYQNLGVLLGETDRVKEAEAACREGLALFKQLAADFPDRPDFRMQLAIAQASVGNALASSGRMKEAEPAYRDALTLFKRLAADLPNQTENRQEVVQVQMHLGDLLKAANRPKEAEAAYRDGVAAGKQLAADFPARSEFRQDLAVICISLGDLLAAGDRPAEAEAVYRDALGLLKQLTADRPGQSEFREGLASTHYLLGRTLSQERRPDDAVAEYRAAIRVKADYPQAHTNLGNILQDTGDVDGAIAEFREAVGTKEDFPEAYKAHNGLGNALAQKGRAEDAIAEYREAIRIDKDFAKAHYGLGNVLFPARVDEAIAEYRETIRIDKDYPEAHCNLGNALAVKGNIDGAVAEYRVAIGLDKDLPPPHQNLARALLEKGQLEEAVAEYREAVRLQKDNANALAQLRQAEQLARLKERLPAVLQGKDQPIDAGEGLAFARLCLPPYRARYTAAVRFFSEAFAAEPKLADDLKTGNRYNAACAAALAAASQDKDATGLEEKDRVRLRRQALDWLRADLAAWGSGLNEAPGDALVADVLQHWLEDSDLAGVRGPDALAKLPHAERQSWQKLWGDVADRATKPPGKSTPEIKSDAK